MGRHSGARRRGPSTVLGALVAGAVLVGGTVTAVAMISRDDDPGAAGTSTSSTTSAVATSEPMTTTSPTETPTTTDTAGADDAAQAALLACRDEAAAGTRLASAASASARDWGTHAGAQWKLDAGTISYAQAEVLWAASKKPGAADVTAFTAADKAYSAVVGGCGRVASATSGTPLEAAGAACAARGKALADVARTGRVVNSQWAGHIAQMKTKATSAGHGYHMEWLRRTSQAKAALADYDKAAAALAKAPACTG